MSYDNMDSLSVFIGLMGSGKQQDFLVEEVYDSIVDTQRELFKFFFEKDETKKVFVHFFN